MAEEAKPAKTWKRGKHHPWAQDSLLLSEVEKRPCLYDRGEENFSNYDLRKQIWKEIGDVVGFTAVEAKQRYRHIRDSFTKRLRKARNRTSSLRTRKFRLANNLQFLIPHIHFGEACESEEGGRQQPKRKRSGEDEELLSAVSVVVEDEDQNQEEGDDSPSLTHIHNHNAVKRRRPTFSNQNGDPMMIVTHENAPRGDELDTFFHTICATVRKLPPVVQSQLKFQIMEMVYKTEIGHLANAGTCSENE